MKRKLLAMLLCTVILFNNALPVLAEMDPAEGNTTETTTTAPEVTEPITPVVCNDCGQEKCVCEDETDTTAAENTSESTATSEDVTTSESTSEEPSSSAAEETDEPCADCTDEAKCEKHAAEITPCETCNTIPCVCPTTETCGVCGVEYTVVEGEEHACETTTCTDCNETYITAVGHECPVVKCQTCNAVIEGEDHVCEEHICEVCQAKYYGETHKCEKAVCDKCEQEYTVALGHDDCPKKCTCINTDGEHFPYCNLYEAEKCEICGEAIVEDVEHKHCELCEELLIEGEDHVCAKAFDVEAAYEYLMSLETDEEIYDFLGTLCEEELSLLEEYIYNIGFEKAMEVESVDFTEAGPFMPAVEVEVARVFRMFAIAKNTSSTSEVTSERVDNEGVITNKTSTPNDDGSYTIRMESYVTGKTTQTEVTTSTPVDIVLVLDQSGSMAYGFDGNSTSTNTARRQYAMKQAVNNFIAAVADKYDEEDADHRMSIVTFGSNASTLQGWTYVDATGETTLKGRIGGLPDSPSGATNVADGMTTAETLMGSGYNYTGENTTRQKVVIVFTDGVPTTQSAFNTTVATNAISSAKNLKDNGVTVYTIGIFNGVDKTQTYGSSNGNVGSSWSADSWFGFGEGAIDTADIAAGNRFLNFLSSNYLSANEIGLTRKDSNYIIYQKVEYTITKTFGRDSSSYYLTATDSSSLNNIFTTISTNIQAGTATIQLGASTVIQDVVTEYFNVPANASAITISTANYNADGTWATAVPSSLVPTIEGNTVYVTGFDFAKNYCDTSYGRLDADHADTSGNFYGSKLIIEFTVTPKTEFLGGNNVPTNGNASGIYTGTTVVENFNRPVVNVPIPEIAVDVVDKNVYYSNSLSGSEMTNGMSATANGNDLLDELDWQDDYVNISTTDPSTLTGLKADTTYSVTVSINPKETTSAEGNSMTAVTGKEGSDTANVYVYRPVLTIADSTIYLGEQPGADYAENTKTITKWVHGTTEADNMIGTAPASFTYGFDTPIAKFDDCKNVNGWITSIGGVDFTATAEEKAPFIVHVMTPTVKWADTERYYGETFPTSFTPVSTTWACKDGETTATNGSTAPTINYTFSTTENGYMPNTTVPVTVTANIGDKTITPTYEWQKCNEDETKPETAQFLVHPLTCSLTITKSGWQTIDSNESFIFTLNGDNAAFPINDLKVVVHGNGTVRVDNLPVGTYTATEDENWSWRYEVDKTKSDVEVTLADSTVGEIYATNSRIEKLWLDFTTWCKNIFVVDNDKVTITTERNED